MSKNKTVIGMMKDELGGRIMKEFIELRAKYYSYLTEDGNKQKEQQNAWWKMKLCLIIM